MADVSAVNVVAMVLLAFGCGLVGAVFLYRADALRYRWFKEQYWLDVSIALNKQPNDKTGLPGTDMRWLNSAIDKKMKGN